MVGEERGPHESGEAVRPAHWSRDGLRPPGGARGPAGSELSPAGLHGSIPGSSSEGSRQSRPSPDGHGPAAPRPLFPTLPGVQLARPASRDSPLTLLAVAFWRLPFGGDVPQPTSGERRPADHRRPGARTGKATPPCVACSRRTPPSCRLRLFAGGGVATFQESEPLQAVAWRGWCPVQPVGKRALFSCASHTSP